MNVVLALILMFLFYRFVFQLIFGNDNGQNGSSSLFHSTGWGAKQIFQLIAWIGKIVFGILKGIFRIFIYNPRR